MFAILVSTFLYF